MKLMPIVCVLASGVLARPLIGEPVVRFTPSADVVDAYDFVEVAINIAEPKAANPFTDVAVEGTFHLAGEAPIPVDGFCDSADGSVYRIRFMPGKAGEYSYSVRYRQPGGEQEHRGSFRALGGKRRGIVRVDKDYPWHFVWEGTGEHYFWNATTTYWLMGWDDQTIRESIDRLHALKVNRLRVVLNGRVKNGRDWYENVFPTDKFKFTLNPWVARQPDSVADPGFDVTRFNIPHWQKYERLLRHAREKDMIISVIFFVDGNKPGMDPFKKAGAGGPDEQRYYRYAAARFAAFSNVMWDLANEYRKLRTDEWADATGDRLKAWDPYDHLASIHGHEDFRFRKSPWADFAMYQVWDEKGGHSFMLKNRDEQAAASRIIPQVNEEYGYEDHYPRAGAAAARPPRGPPTIAGASLGRCPWPAAIRRRARGRIGEQVGGRIRGEAGSTAVATRRWSCSRAMDTWRISSICLNGGRPNLGMNWSITRHSAWRNQGNPTPSICPPAVV